MPGPPRGNISPDQIVDHEATPGNVPMYDAYGILIDSGTTPGGGGTLPVSFPNVSGEFLDSYDSSTGLFTASTPSGGGGGTGLGTVFTPPPMTGWTQVNFSAGSSAAFSSVSARIHIEDNSSHNWRLLTRPQTGDFDLVAFINAVMFGINSSTVGLYISDGTKLMGIEYLAQSSFDGWRVAQIPSPTGTDTQVASFSGSVSVYPGPIFGGSWVRIVRNSGTYHFYLGLEGSDWIELYNESVGAFLTSDRVGFGGISISGSASRFVRACCLSWAGVA